MKTNLGKYYDHRPEHFRFPNRIDDFEPDANEGDWLVIGGACAIVGGIALWAFIFYAIGLVTR